MPLDYVDAFPLPAAVLPPRLRALLEPVGSDPEFRVEVTSRFDFDQHGPRREYVHMIMAVVPEDGSEVTPLLGESGDGVVSSSTPDVREKGGLERFEPSISGHDYVVASWGDHNFFSFHLAEKVWMSLGLSARSLGGEQQRLIYDDLGLPEFGVAEGEILTEYYFTSKRDVSWTMSNEYLRRYLWMRGAYGVRVFFYQALLEDQPELRALMNGREHERLKPEGGWYEVDLREFDGGLLLQVWATVRAVSPELCRSPTADGLLWPGTEGAMTHARADALRDPEYVYLDDRFLEHYEQNSFFDTTPSYIWGQWWCSPSYGGQWNFTEVIRLGRNLLRVPMRELYKPKPDREILRAHAFALPPDRVALHDLNEEHIVSKTQRLLDAMLDLGDNLSALGDAVGVPKPGAEIVGFSRIELRANGWRSYPELRRLAQVAPLALTQQAFLARCKSLHEIWQRIPNGFLRSLLMKAGYERAAIKDLGSMKLLQGLLNVVQALNAEGDALDAFSTGSLPSPWQEQNPALSALFVNHALRIADAHDAGGEVLASLERLGFDVADLNQGYGRALDLVFDGVVAAFSTLNAELAALRER